MWCWANIQLILFTINWLRVGFCLLGQFIFFVHWPINVNVVLGQYIINTFYHHSVKSRILFVGPIDFFVHWPIDVKLVLGQLIILYIGRLMKMCCWANIQLILFAIIRLRVGFCVLDQLIFFTHRPINVAMMLGQ